jgi:hypothetical protein
VQKQRIFKKGNWLDVSLQHAFALVESGLKIANATQFWGLQVFSLRNHLYTMMLTKCKNKLDVHKKSKEIMIKYYIKMM